MKQEDLIAVASIVGAVVVLLVIISLLSPASAQSFSCRNADTRGEAIICDSPSLRALDVRMNRAYLRALRDDARRADRIQNRQRAWIISRDRCRSEGCVRQHYLERLGELR
jgi:uncharacterized protein